MELHFLKTRRFVDAEEEEGSGEQLVEGVRGSKERRSKAPCSFADDAVPD